MHDNSYQIRPATLDDLPAINQIVTDAVNTWQLPERVKRLSLPGYLYTVDDMEHMTIFVVQNTADNLAGSILGVIALETPRSEAIQLIHGLYVSPQYQRQGIGRQLFSYAENWSREQGSRQLLVRAQAEAAGFYEINGMQQLQPVNPDKEYKTSYIKDL